MKEGKRMDKKGRNWTMVDTLYWLGAALLSLAAGALAAPAGLAVAGVGCLAGAWLIDRSGGGKA